MDEETGETLRFVIGFVCVVAIIAMIVYVNVENTKTEHEVKSNYSDYQMCADVCSDVYMSSRMDCLRLCSDTTLQHKEQRTFNYET